MKWIFTDHSNYQTTPGTILSSRVVYKGATGGWRFLITYEYSVDGEAFTSDRVHYGYQALSNKSYAQNYVENYSTGKTVTVYYNPIVPRMSVLEPNVKWYGDLYFVGLTLIIDLILFTGSYRLLRKHPK